MARPKSTAPSRSRLLTQSEAARLLGITRQSVSGFIRPPLLDVEEVAGVRFVTRASVERYLQRRHTLSKARTTR